MPINNKNSMGKSRARPVFLNLFVIRLPIGGIVSIFHRITGVILVLLTPVAIYFFGLSLNHPEQFHRLWFWLGLWPGRLALLLLLALFIQHLFSGLRHLALDIDWGVDKQSARISAWATLVVTVAVLGTVLLGWLA